MENTDLFVVIDHVGLAVTWFPRCGHRVHTNVLGWRLLHREDEEQGVEEAMIGTGEQLSQNAQIQLLAPLNETSTIAKFLDRNGPGMQQLAYRVSDLDKDDELPARRALPVPGGPGAAPTTAASTSATPRTPARRWSSSSRRMLRLIYENVPQTGPSARSPRTRWRARRTPLPGRQ
ncbi:VOC family protein [Propioniciclava flava]